MGEFNRYVELESVEWISLVDRCPIDDPDRLGEMQKLRLTFDRRKPSL
jgi:hypothetical protein